MLAEKLPDADDGQNYYRARAVGRGMKPNRWHGFVLAKNPEEAEAIIEDGYPDVTLSIQGIRNIRVSGLVDPVEIEGFVRGATHPNELLFRDVDGQVRRLHSGMLK